MTRMSSALLLLYSDSAGGKSHIGEMLCPALIKPMMQNESEDGDGFQETPPALLKWEV